jgi:hypothetical protein
VEERKKIGVLKIALALLGVVAVVAVIASIWAIFKNISVDNEMIRQENSLNTQYPTNQVMLADCLVRIKQSAQFATAETDKLDEVLSNAVKGRYSAGGNAPQVDNGKFFSAITESYPNLQGLHDAFNRAFNTMNGCRRDYAGAQTLLLDRLRTYDDYRLTWPNSMFANDPSDSKVLRAAIGGDVKTGQAALDRMRDVVTSKDAKKAYESGELDTDNPFSPAPTR